MAMVDVAAVRGRDELDDLAGVQRPVDGLEGAACPAPGPRRSRTATSRSADRTAWTRPRSRRHQRIVAGDLGADAVGALDVDDAAVDEPGEGVVEGRELVHRETILGVIGVQEVEGVLEIDVMGVASVDWIGSVRVHLDNHTIPIDRLRARGYIT